MDSLRTWGDPNAPLMVLLDSPTRDDMKEGRLLSGYQGRMLQRAFSGRTFQVLTLFPEPLAKTPTQLALGEAIEALRARMANHSCTVLIPMGRHGLRATTGWSSIMDWRGYCIKPDPTGKLVLKVKVLSTYKTDRPAGKTTPARKAGDPKETTRSVERPFVIPAGVKEIIPTLDTDAVQASGLALMETMYADIDRACAVATGAPILELAPLQFASEPTLSPSNTITIDIENTLYGRITHMGMMNRGELVSQEISTEGQLQEIYHPYIQTADRLVAHNAAHEYRHLRNHFDLEHTKLWCTMLAAYMLEPDSKKSLNWVISRHLTTRRHKHLAEDNMNTYNALDVLQTDRLYHILRDQLRNTCQLDFFERGMMPAIPTLTKMTIRGIGVDVAYAKDWHAKLMNQLLSLKQRDAHSIFNYPKRAARHFNIKNSDEESLLKLKAKGHPESDLIDKLLEYREVVKQLSYVQTASVNPSYLPGTRDTDEGNKGIAYSGRPTASKPNIQNQPPDARRQFIPHEGYRFASLDWSQIEPRISAALSGDDVMAADIQSGLYDAVAQTLSCDRSTAKLVVLLSSYLGSPRTLQNKLLLNGVTKSFKECKHLQDAMFARYSQWFKWREQVLWAAEQMRYLSNTFGKRAPFVRVHPAKAVNFHPQSTAACILWYCLPQVERAIAPMQGEIVTTVHDEILIQAPTDQIEHAANAARGVMQQEWPVVARGFKVPVKIKYGPNWRDMYAPDDAWQTWDGF